MNSSEPKGRVTLRDIAKKLGVSHTTVSRALQDAPRFSKELRERVRRDEPTLVQRVGEPLDARTAAGRRGRVRVRGEEALHLQAMLGRDVLQELRFVHGLERYTRAGARCIRPPAVWCVHGVVNDTKAEP